MYIVCAQPGTSSGYGLRTRQFSIFGWASGGKSVLIDEYFQEEPIYPQYGLFLQYFNVDLVFPFYLGFFYFDKALSF